MLRIGLGGRGSWWTLGYRFSSGCFSFRFDQGGIACVFVCSSNIYFLGTDPMFILLPPSSDLGRFFAKRKDEKRTLHVVILKHSLLYNSLSSCPPPQTHNAKNAQSQYFQPLSLSHSLALSRLTHHLKSQEPPIDPCQYLAAPKHNNARLAS